MFLNTKKKLKKGGRDLKTFNYESNCVKYKDCYFDMNEYPNGNIYLETYGKVEDEKETSHISSATVNVKEKLPENQIVIDNYNNSNLITFLMDIGIVKSVVKRVAAGGRVFPVVEVDLELLRDYSYEMEELKYAG